MGEPFFPVLNSQTTHTAVHFKNPHWEKEIQNFMSYFV